MGCGAQALMPVNFLKLLRGIVLRKVNRSRCISGLGGRAYVILRYVKLPNFIAAAIAASWHRIAAQSSRGNAGSIPR
jgi:hypothetical protein